MRVADITFLRRSARGAEQATATVADPLVATQVPINERTNAIRIRFTKPFEQNTHLPETHGLGDPDFKRHNVQVLPLQPLGGLEFVPGSLVVEAPDTVRFDLFTDSPYARGGGNGWQKGPYRIVLRGTDKPAQGRPALVDLAGKELDGEPKAAGTGVISGDGNPGGDFSAEFVVG